MRVGVAGSGRWEFGPKNRWEVGFKIGGRLALKQVGGSWEVENSATPPRYVTKLPTRNSEYDDGNIAFGVSPMLSRLAFSMTLYIMTAY